MTGDASGDIVQHFSCCRVERIGQGGRLEEADRLALLAVHQDAIQRSAFQNDIDAMGEAFRVADEACRTRDGIDSEESNDPDRQAGFFPHFPNARVHDGFARIQTTAW